MAEISDEEVKFKDQLERIASDILGRPVIICWSDKGYSLDVSGPIHFCDLERFLDEVHAYDSAEICSHDYGCVEVWFEICK